jgi:hypothetical protein
MFNSQILDVAIGMIFVYLLLSLMCSAANELIELWLKNRAADLERGLKELLKDKDGSGMVKDVYSHQLVNSLFEGEYKPGLQGLANKLLGKVNLPSYIPSRNFALALMDLIPRISAAAAVAKTATTAAVTAPSGATNATVSPPPPPAAPPQVTVNVAGGASPGVAPPPPTVALAPPPPTATSGVSPASSGPLFILRNALQSFPNQSVQQALIPLIEAAGDDPAKARQNIEDWYNASMDRVSGWYKRRAQVIILLIGLFVTMGLNADSITIANRLASDRALRESVVAAADAYAKANAEKPTPTPTPTPTPKPSPSPKASPSPIPSPTPNNTSSSSASPTPKTSPSPTATADVCWKDECHDPESPQCKLKKSQCTLQSLGLPIGWELPDEPQTKWPGLHFWTAGFWSGWAVQLRSHVLGWLLTALALSLGAPFWFDMLNKFIVIRSTVKPKEKSQDEKSKS